MTTLSLVAFAVALFLTGFHILACILASLRVSAVQPGGSRVEPLSTVISVAGLDGPEIEVALSALALASPTVEVLYCAYDEKDPAVGVLRQQLAATPAENVRLLIGRSRVSRNPKLDNIEKALDAAANDLVVFVDGNMRMPPDFVKRVMAEWDDASTGAVSSPPLGVEPANFWAEVECAMLNTLFARYLLAADHIGAGFVQGKVFMMRRSFLAAHGGMQALEGEPVEDGAATRLVRAAGRKVRAVTRPFEQPLGHRALTEVWQRTLRWSQQRRHSYPIVFTLEPLITAIPALAMTAMASIAGGLPTLPIVFALTVLWYGVEALLALRAGWPLNGRFVFAVIARDIMAILAWSVAWWRTRYVWRGHAVDLAAK
ncbi:MAG: glycosyltransferase [Proteobacteria bacterium]|nr:glycosyltransferase [Pseudomonadota bacterium]